MMLNRAQNVLFATAVLVVYSGIPLVSGEALDVCRAIKVTSAKALILRGTGEIGRHGLVLGDTTCPVAKSSEISLPALIKIEVGAYASASVRAKYRKFESSEPAPLVQVLARGDLTCKSNFIIRRNETGEIIAGNGYGSNGLIKCKLFAARLIALEDVHGPAPGFEVK